MLKASEVKMMDGSVYNGVDLIPSDDGFILLDDDKVVQVMHHAVASITYTDAGSGHYAKGRALAMYYDDSEKVKEILEEFGYELEELATFISESMEPQEAESDTKDGENPYA